MTPTKQQAQAALDYISTINTFGGTIFFDATILKTIRQALQSIIDAPETITRGSGDVFKDLGIEGK